MSTTLEGKKAEEGMKSGQSKKTQNERAGLRHDQRGAVLAEFVVVLVPLITIFFVFTQLSAIAIARLKFKHAAVIGARAAAVYSNSGENCPECTSDGKAETTAGVRAAVGSNSGITIIDVNINDTSDRNDPYNLVTVTVTGRYRCGVPLGQVICGGMGTWREVKSMPHQGARYKKE